MVAKNVTSSSKILLTLYQLPHSVFTFREIELLFPTLSPLSLKRRMHYYIVSGDLLRLRKGIYAKKQYKTEEAATKVYIPSYISFETVLAEAGIVFQYDSTIHVASYTSRSFTIGATTIQLHRLPTHVLYNPDGIINRNGVAKATKERAYLDALYLYHSFFIDAPHRLDPTVLTQLLPLYRSHSLEEHIQYA